MSSGFNKAVIMGNAARDPEIRYLSSGKDRVARFAVAVGRQWKNRETGETVTQTDFIPVVAWNFHAELAEKYIIKKGSAVLVEGRIQVKKFTDAKTGTDRWSTDVVAENIVLLGGRRDDNQQAGQGRGSDSGSGQPAEGANDTEGR